MSFDSGLAATGEWECMECGHIEQGVKTKPPRVCPDCDAPGQALEFFPYGDEEDAGDLEDELFDDDDFEVDESIR